MGNNGIRAAEIAKILLDHGAGVDVADEVRKLVHYDIMSEFCFAMCNIALESRGYAFSCFMLVRTTFLCASLMSTKF